MEGAHRAAAVALTHPLRHGAGRDGHPADISVRVFNGGFTSGLANRVGTHLERAGFSVLKVGNTEEPIVGTVIRANEREAAQVSVVAAQFTEPVIEYDDRVDGTLDVLVGTDFKGTASSPSITQAPSAGGQICRVPSPSPSPSPSVSPRRTGPLRHPIGQEAQRAHRKGRLLT